MTPEARLKQECKALFEFYGFYYRSLSIGVIPGRRNPSRGMPDAIVILRGVVAWIEYKRAKGGVFSKEQQDFLYEWGKHGGNVFVVRTVEECADVIRRIRSQADQSLVGADKHCLKCRAEI